jgi:O-antigen/teichoic acid export membrane protein
MSTQTNEAPLTIDHKPHATFFRQSGWLMIATIVSGIMALGVHFLNKLIDEAEYAKFGVLLMLVACVPTIPLQMVFTHQAAATLAKNRIRQLAGMIHRAWVWTFVIWLVAAVGVAIFHQQIEDAWHLTGSAGLYITMTAILASIWSPLFTGVLQGRQDFFWYGWSVIVGGILRVVGAAALVIIFHMGATGMLAGALAAVAASGVICMWRTRDLWGQAPEPFNAREVFSQILPLVLGFGVCQFLFTTDTMYATPHFSGTQMKDYIAAGTLSRALLWLVLPMAAVMFPKIVHSSVKREKSNLLGVVILGTAILGVLSAAGLCLVGPIVVRIVFKAGNVAQTTALLPWYVGAMIPLALANVLANDLLGRARFKAVPFMIVLALAYGFTLPYLLNRSPVQPDPKLATIVGSEAVPQREVNRKFWNYIRDHNLQDPSDKTRINADQKLKEVFDSTNSPESTPPATPAASGHGQPTVSEPNQVFDEHGQATVSKLNDAVLNHVKGDMTIVLKTLGVFNVLLFLLCAVFTWGIKYEGTMPVATQGA